MKITHGNQTIDLFAEHVPSLAPISLSGGADSTSLFYLVSKHFPDVELITYTCRDQNAPVDAKAAKQIVEWMQSEFPNNKIHDIQVFDFNDRTEDFVTYEEVDQVTLEYPQFKGMRRTQVSKIIQVDKISWNIMKESDAEIRLDGMTRNPPSDEMKKLGFFDKGERRRDKELPKVIEWRQNKEHPPLSIYQPYANVDKKFVAGVFQDHNLMETLYPLTRSCVGTARQTDNFKHVCNECFWCAEKAWAFDLPNPIVVMITDDKIMKNITANY